MPGGMSKSEATMRATSRCNLNILSTAFARRATCSANSCLNPLTCWIGKKSSSNHSVNTTNKSYLSSQREEDPYSYRQRHNSNEHW